MPSTVVTGRAGPCPGVEILRGERLARAHTLKWAMSTNTNMGAVAEFIGEGLEADPTRGVRIKPSAFHAVPGVPRSSEYDSVLEQDPFGDTHETGGNDDIWGEWGGVNFGEGTQQIQEGGIQQGGKKHWLLCEGKLRKNTLHATRI